MYTTCNKLCYFTKTFYTYITRQIFFSNGVNKQKYPKSAKLGHATGWLFLVNFETWGPTREFLKHFKSNNSDRIFDNLLKNTTKIYSGPNLNFYRCRKDQHYSQPKKKFPSKNGLCILTKKRINHLGRNVKMKKIKPWLF